jgi:uncharacterized protein YecE (DUF72 family)
MRIWIGTSGWQYRDWRGTFYPQKLPQREWLIHYASGFDTVEVNNSFYRLPETTTFEHWRDVTPDGFLFAVKANRYLTHIRRLREPAEPLELFWSRARVLGPRLGPVLFQLPPRFPAEDDRLETFLRALPTGLQAAFEFRDPSWHTPAIFDLLSDAGAALVWADRPGRRIVPPLTAEWAYVRFHQGRRDTPGYPRAKLRRWADRLARLPVRELFVYFNNDEEAAAPRDAVTFRSLLEVRVGG